MKNTRKYTLHFWKGNMLPTYWYHGTCHGTQKKSIEKFLTPYSDKLTDYKEDEVGDDDEADEEEEEG